MLIIPYIATIIYGWICKQKKEIWLWCAILLIVIIPLTSGDFADYKNYSKAYELIGRGEYSSLLRSELSIGWMTINKLFYMLGLSYRGFMAVLILLCFGILHYIVNRYFIQENVFWSLFLVFPALIQCTQIRFFLATMICIIALQMIIEDTKHSMIKYVLLVLLSSLFHYATATLLIYLTIPIFEKYSRKKAIAFTLVLFIVTFLSLRYISQIASYFIPSMRYSRYFGEYSEKSTFSRYLFLIIIWLLSVIIIYKYRGQINKSRYRILRKQVNFEESTIVVNRICLVIMLTGITIPLLYFDSSFHRYFEISYLYLYIIISNYLKIGKKPRKNYLLKKSLILFLFSIIVFDITRMYVSTETMLNPYFSMDGFYSLVR